MASIINLVAEADIDAAVAWALAENAGFARGTIFVKGGKSKIDAHLNGYNNAARRAPWFVIRDLDRDADCAPELIRKLIPKPAPQLVFRVAVREIETWLMADYSAVAKFFNISAAVIPSDPETLADPKAAMINLARRSRKTSVKGMIPSARGGRSDGPEYSSLILEFVNTQWDVIRAIDSGRSPSLEKAHCALERLKATLG